MTSKKPRARVIKKKARVLVTGAAGGVGRHVVRALLDAGYTVRATDVVSRDDAVLAPLIGGDEKLEWIDFNFSVWHSVDHLVEGCEAIVHAAAIVSLSESFEELSAVNVEFTRKLHEAAGRAGVKHFVHMSCASVYQYDRGVRTEASPLQASSPYERTKIRAEEALRQDGPDAGPVPWTVLRPGLVYGPHCTTMGAGMATLPPILRGFMKYLPGLRGGPRTNWCHVEDLAAAVVTVLGRPEAFGRAFNVADETPLSFGEVLTSLTEAYGLEVGPVVPFPNAAIWAVASPLIDHDLAFDAARGLLRTLWRRIQSRHDLHSPLRPRVDRNALFYVTDDAILICGALKELGWTPRHPDFRKGIVATVRWYQEQGWVPRFDTETRVKLRDERTGLGLGLTEVFAGPWTRADGSPGGRMQLNADLEITNVWRALSGVEGQINGYVGIDGLVHDAPVRGILTLRLLPVPRLEYEFGFEDGDRNSYRFRGVRRLRKGLRLDELLRLEGTLMNKFGEPIGAATLSVNPREQLVPLLASVRLVG